MTVSGTGERDAEAGRRALDREERRTLGVTCGAHVLHDGYTDLVWVALPIWQAEFGLSYAAVGLLRTIYSGTLASLQIPASAAAARIGAGAMLAAGTAAAGLCYVMAGVGSGLWFLVVALFVGGFGAATQHPICSALVTGSFTGSRALKAFGTYNFAGDVGKVLVPGAATSLLLVTSWRSAYALLGIVGIVAAVAIILLMPRATAEPQEKAEHLIDPPSEDVTARMRSGFRILVAFGIADSVVRGALFVCLPFLLIGKGAAVTTAGFALTLVFIGGAAGKLACGWVANWLGNVATIVGSQALTAAGIAGLLLLPLHVTLVVLPFLGLVLNGVTTVIYGSVPNYVAPKRRAAALSMFYTVTIGAAALAPPVAGLVGDLIGIPATVLVVSALALATIALAFLLKDPRSVAAV